MLHYLRIENFKAIDDAVTVELSGQSIELNKGSYGSSK